MARTGPQKYPGASTAYWYSNRYPGSAMESNVIVWHSTEGTSVPTYGGGASAPTITAAPDFANKRMVWYQHFDFDESARALVNKAGGVETNTANVVQVEIVGTCDPSAHSRWSAQHLYTPELPDWAIRDLAAFARWAYENHGVPLTSGLTFKPYPSSYGANGVRMSGSAWNSFRGHCGHQHVTENDHGDPGAFPMAEILAVAAGADTEREENDVPKYISLGMTEPLTLKSGEWKTITFNAEWVDDLDQHYEPGQTFARGAHYNGTLYVNADGLELGNELQVRLVEDDVDAGKTVKTFPPTEVVGTGGGTYSYVPAVGVVGKDRRVKFQVAAYQDGVTLKRAELKAHLWAL